MQRREPMKFNGKTAAQYIHRVIIPECQAFADVVTNRLLPTFDNFGKEAIEHGEKWFRDKVGNPDPLNYEEPGAAEYFAEEEYKANEYFASKAIDETLLFADMLIGMLYASTALYSAGFFHLFEQHAAELQVLVLRGHPKEISLKDVTRWLKKDAGVDVATLGNWDTIYNDLRLVANAVKHAEGRSTAQLRLKRPELFIHPRERQGLMRTTSIRLPVRKPLFGEDLYIAPSDFCGYSKAVVGFWTELAELLGQD